MKIKKVIGREIFDSRGLPTVSCEITLENGVTVKSSVPSGKSCSKKEAFELRDHDKNRLMGQGVLKAIHNIEYTIGSKIIGQEPDLVAIDDILQDLDATPDKRILGANATLAVSMAVCKAQAAAQNLELFEMIAELYGAESVSLPFPLLNVFNGGVHADNHFPIQEIMLVPIGAQNFRASLEASVTVFYELKRLLQEAKKSTAVGDEGGFCPVFATEYEPFDFIVTALKNTDNQDLFRIGLDVAADQLYNQKTGMYRWKQGEKTSEQLFAFYKKLEREYPLFSIEDGFSQDDIEGWKMLFEQFGNTLQIVGDDIFATNSQEIIKGVEQEIANAVIIKPNQIGTVTETFQAIAVCQEVGMNAIISHRSGETNDTFIADLAVGTSSGQIKAGAPCRGERMAKYNRLLEIEETLTMDLLNF